MCFKFQVKFREAEVTHIFKERTQWCRAVSLDFIPKASNSLVLLTKEVNQNLLPALYIFLGSPDFVYCFSHFFFFKCLK